MPRVQNLYPVDVYMFRHGEGVHQLNPDTMAGQSNYTELTGRGIKQGLQLGRVLDMAEIRPTRVYASKAVRAIDTGKWALKAMGLGAMQIQTQVELQELGHGPWEGRPRSEAYPPHVLAQIPLLGKDFRLDGGESMSDVIARGRDWCSREAPEPTPTQERYFVFTHGMFMKCVIGDLLGWDQEQIYHTRIDNTWAVQLRGSGEEWDVIHRGVDAAEL